MSLLNFVKIVYRLFRYKAEWKKRFREIQIRKVQRKSIKLLNPKVQKLIIFFIPGPEYYSGKENITGGLISIVSLAQETMHIFSDSSIQTICSTFYGHHLIFKLTSFENKVEVLNACIIEHYFTDVNNVIIHIPELFVMDFVNSQKGNKWLKNIQSVQINILNQNIQLMPELRVIAELKAQYSNCTMTTAHKKYCNEFYRNYYGLPCHLLSVWISPEDYIKTDYQNKKDLILFSPDNRELTIELIKFLKIMLPRFDFQIIQGLKYEVYKHLIASSKFIITTGEGLDAYFIETYFSGGVAFALKNLDFFDSKYLDLPCLIDPKADIEFLLINLIREYDVGTKYSFLNKKVSNLLAQDYSYSVYKHNLMDFYNKHYLYC